MKFFKPSDDWEFNSRISRFDNVWLLYGEGFSIATELLGKYILNKNRSDQDFVIYPYCYLIRHFIEIRLKEIIDEGSKLKGLENSPLKGGHDLSVLWLKAQEVLRPVIGENYRESPTEITDFIMELRTVDLKSDNFRYPIDNEGQPNLNNTPIINFRLVADGFSAVKGYLEGITDFIAVLKDDRERNSW